MKIENSFGKLLLLSMLSFISSVGQSQTSGPNCLADNPPALSLLERGPNVKFFKGHYVAIGKRRNFLETLDDIKTVPRLRGVLVRYPWSKLETAQGNYSGLKIIADDLNAAQARGKKLAVMIMFKYKDGDPDIATTPQREDSPMPDYLHTLTGGKYYYKIGGAGTGPSAEGYLAKLENPIVVQRLRAFMVAFAAKFDNHPALSAVMFAETATSVKPDTVSPIDPTTLINENLYFAGLMKVDKTASCALKKTPFIQLTNSPQKEFFQNLFFSTYGAHTIGFGGPDVYTNDLSLNTGVYSRYESLAGKVPISMLVASENYEYESFVDYKADHDATADGSHTHDKSYSQSINDIASFANTTLRANYVFWKRDAGSNPYYLQVRNKALSTGSDRLPVLSEGMNCPSQYLSCVNE